MGRIMTKNPTWVQLSDDLWGDAVGGESDHSDWLRGLDAPELPTSALDPLPDVKAPLLQTWIAEYQLSRLVGPHEQTWKYRWGIEKEISRMSSACRESVGTERESNLKQLRDAEAARSEFCETPEFRAAVAYALAVVDRVIEAAGNDLTPAQITAKARYAEIRASLEALTAQPSDVPESSKERHSEERSGAAAMTVLRRAVILERLARRYPKLENNFQRGESWLKACSVPGMRGYYFFELVERACISRWGGSSGSELSPLDCFSTQAQLAIANRR